ncbi:MAG: peptidoglycan recognition family protein [Trueperaceae bacterium]|nr:peptidoglycan recognition family protein [Trueperaceae bacterium]
MPEFVEVSGASWLNVRTQRGVVEDATKIATLKEGTVFEVAEYQDGWAKLVLARDERLGNEALYGWVNRNYLRSQSQYPPYPSAQDKTLSVENIVDDLPKHDTKRYRERDLADLEAHIVHHSGVSVIQSPKRIAEIHVDKGWPGIGYTFFITPSGEIKQTNHVKTMSYATKNQNHRYLSTVLPGDFTNGKPTSEQVYALRWLHHKHIPAILGRKLPLVGHKEGIGQSTSCPGDQWDWRRDVDAE